LQREHLQTVAVVLSFLPKRQSAALLCRLDERRRGEVLARIARLDSMDDATVNVVADELRHWIAQQQAKASVPREGQQIAASIADAAPPSQRDHLIAALQKGTYDSSCDGDDEVPPRSEEPPSPPRLEFWQIAQLSDEQLLAVMQQTPPDTLQLALSGADESLLERVTMQLPRRAAKKFRKSLTLNGPTRLLDIDRAQAQVAEIADRVAANTSPISASR